MILGYNTNGYAHHRLEDAIEIIAELGYGGIALTPDVNHLNLFRNSDGVATRQFRNHLDKANLRCVVETGARFLLDPRRKHQPTILSPTLPDRIARRDFLQLAVVFSPMLRADCVSFWSGTATDDAPHTELMGRLVDECKQLADYAAAKNVRLAFEPEPGMFIDTMDKFAELHARVNHPFFGLTLDVGHLVCMNELPISKYIHQWKHCLWNVHLDDMKRGVHDHLMFGEGEVDFDDVFTALKAIDYIGMASVELSRHSYDAVNAATKSIQFLKPYFTSPSDSKSQSLVSASHRLRHN